MDDLSVDETAELLVFIESLDALDLPELVRGQYIVAKLCDIVGQRDSILPQLGGHQHERHY